MRVLYASHDYSTHDRRFLQALVSGGHETHFVAVGRAETALEFRGVPETVRQWAWTGSPVRDGAAARAEVGRWRELLAALKPDVVHAGPLPSVALCAALAGGVPLLAMSWGSDVMQEAAGDEIVRRDVVRVLTLARGVVADCHAVRDLCVAWQPLSAPKLTVFPWGLDLPRYRPSSGGGAGALVVLSTRTWAPIYGIATVLRGFASAAGQIEALRLLLAGDGPLREEVRVLVSKLGIADRVTMPGRVSQDAIADLYGSADVYVSASHSDGTSISLLEAMASALPVVVSDLPANREWIGPDDSGGFLVPVGDAAELARSLVQLQSTQLRARMGRRNREVALARADWRQHEASYLDAVAAAAAP